MGNRLVINNTVNFSTPKPQTKNNKIKKTPSFKGSGAAAIVNMMQAIENGGVAATFTIQDFLGLNIPRTIYNLYRNKDLTGQLNKEASFETGLREFLTGPSMMAIPAALFAVTKNVFGKSSDIQFPLLRRIGEHFENIDHAKTLNKDIKVVNKELYNKIFKNIFDKTFKEKVTDLELENVTKQAMELKKKKDKLSKISRLKKSKRKPLKKEIKELEESILEFILQKNKKSGNISSPYTVKFSSKNQDIANINFRKLLKSINKYSNDMVSKTIKKIEKTTSEVTKEHVKKYIENSNLKRIGGRFFSTSLAVLTIAGFSYFIPKIYSRSEKPPGEIGLETGGENASKK